MSDHRAIRVNVVCEDRTGTGLAMVIRSAVNAARDGAGKVPISLKGGTVLNNSKLLEECAKYELYRFSHRPRHDHVVYVIDALRLWELKCIPVAAPKPNQDLTQYLDSLSAAARDEMTRRARGLRSDEQWQPMSAGFHPHVLVWERESLMLPVSDALGLGQPPPDPIAIRHPAGWVENRLREHQRSKYEKSIHGPRFLEQIARSSELRDRVLASNPSFAAIVDELARL